jgi:trehalose/maltose hydrolase-like predicted phosphorylase
VAKIGAAPLNPRPLTSFEPGALPPYLSNGLIGLRPGAGLPTKGVAIANGLVGVDPVTHVEGFAQAPYPLAFDLTVDGVRLVDGEERCVLREQSYDFSCGELTTSFVFDAGATAVEVKLIQWCSRARPTVCAQQVDVHVSGPCDLQLAVGIDPGAIPGNWAGRTVQPAESCDGAMEWRSHGHLSTCGAAYSSDFAGADADPGFDRSDTRPLKTTYAFRARSRRRYRVRQLTSIVTEALHPQPQLQAVRLLHAASSSGFDRIRDDDHIAWRELWQARPLLLGASERWQELVDAAFFYLHTSAHPSSPCSTSMFGLAYWPDYHYYRGHVMWDIETFAVPPLLLTQPDAARALLDYRIDRLPGARSNAASNGYRGAQYPWESGPLTGHEAAPGEGAAAAHEHHVSLDVAYALIQYVHATGDVEYGRERVRPVLEQICRWIESRVTKTARGYEILGANGVAEKATPVDNNAFVNMATAVVLRETGLLAPTLGLDAHPAWESIRQNLYLPLDGRRRVVLNHDKYRRNEEKGETPEALAGLFPYTYDLPAEVEEATYASYLELADRYVGSPMLSALLGVYAARLGRREQSLDLFEKGYAAFILEPFTITAEYDPRVFPEQEIAGPFTANLGAFLTSCLYGLTGIRLSRESPQQWCNRPVTMPLGWDGIEVERLLIRGRPASLLARHGDQRATLTLEE